VAGDAASIPSTDGCELNVTYPGFAGNLPEPAVLPASVSSVSVQGVQDGDAVPLQPGGRFALTLAGYRTGYVPQDATATELKEAIEMIAGVGNVAVARSSQADANFGYTWTVEFEDIIGDVPLMVGDSQSLAATLPVVSVTEFRKGTEPSFDSGAGGLPLGSFQHVAGESGDAIPETSGMSAFVRFITGLDQGIPYAVRVTAFNAQGASEPAFGFPRLVVPMP